MSVGDLYECATADIAQREVGNEDDVLPFAVVDDRLMLALGEAVVVLNCGDRHDHAGSLELVDRDVGHSDLPDLSVVAVLLDRAETLFERCLRVWPVQVIEPDAVGAQPTEALLDLGAQDLRVPAAGAAPSALRRYYITSAIGRERPTDRLLALPAGVGVSGVDHPDPRGDRFLNEGDVRRGIGEAVRPQPDAGDLGVAESQLHRPVGLDVHVFSIDLFGPVGRRRSLFAHPRRREKPGTGVSSAEM